MSTTGSNAAPPRPLAVWLRGARDRVLEAWRRRVLEDPAVPAANGLSRPELRDEVPRLLDELADALDRRVPAAGASASAEAHARDRAARAYSVGSAICELSHLRSALLAACEAEGVLAAPGEMAIVHAGIDGAMRIAAIELDRAARARAEADRARLRAVLDILPAAVFVADVSGRVIEQNRAVAAVWGTRVPTPSHPGEYAAFRAWDPATGEPLDPARWALARALRGDTTSNEELDILSFDGDRRTVLNSAAPLRDESGAIVGAVAVNVDVTDRVREQRARAAVADINAAITSPRSLEEIFATVTSALVPRLASFVVLDVLGDDDELRRVAVAHVSPDKQAQLCSGGAPLPSRSPHRPLGRALATGRPELVRDVSRAWLDAVVGQDADRALIDAIGVTSLIVAPLVARGATLGALTFAWAEPGRRYDERDLAVAEDLAGMIALSIDSARLHRDTVRAVAERDESLARLDGLLASSPVGIALLDRELRYVRINDVLARMNGATVEAHLGRTVGEMLPARGGSLVPLLARVRDTGEPVLGLEVAWEPSHPESPARFVASYFPVRTRRGETVGVGGVVTDVSDQHRVAEELRRDVALRERFIAILGHDLRSPLASITMTTETLLRTPDLPGGQVKALRRIATSASRIARMIDDLLDVTHIRTRGALPIQPKPVDLADLGRQVVDELEIAHPTRSIRLVVSGDTAGTWDPDRLAQVLSNLVSNALAYGAADAPVDVTVRGDGGDVLVAVHNTGPPIPPKAAAIMFDPFRRGVEVARRARGGGLGLGLFISKGIVESHGGSIAVESSAELGTTFTARLPRGR